MTRWQVARLEGEANELKQKQEALAKTIAELEASIARYKEEYAVLIAEVQEIKAEMAKVKTKVDRSIALIQNLSAERLRWEAESAAFEARTLFLRTCERTYANADALPPCRSRWRHCRVTRCSRRPSSRTSASSTSPTVRASSPSGGTQPSIH
jgi:hypothetical protein